MAEENQNEEGVNLFTILGGIGATALAIPRARRKIASGIKSLFRDDDKKFTRGVDNFASKQEVKKLNEIVEDNKSTDLTMTPEMRKAQEALRAEQDEMEDIKKRVIKEPLTFGGKVNNPDYNTATDQNIGRRDPTYNFGSTLYDFIALHPAKKSLSADQWIAELSNPQRMAGLRYKTPGYQNIEAGVTKQELEDVNIAKFDGNKLVGGLLKAAKDSDVKISKKLLLEMAENTPAARLEVTEYGVPIQTIKKIDRFYDKLTESYKHDVENVVPKLKTVASSEIKDADIKRNFLLQADDAANTTFTRLINQRQNLHDNFAEGGQQSLFGNNRASVQRELQNRIDKKINVVDEIAQAQGLYDPNTLYPKTAKALRTMQETMPNKAKEEAQALAVEIADDYEKIFRQPLREVQTKYQQHKEYKLAGAEATGEIVVNIRPRPGTYVGRRPKAVDASVRGDEQSHYQDGPQSVDQLYFARYGIRSDYYNPDMKGITIDEIQADIAQAVAKRKKSERKKPRINPFNVKFQNALSQERIRELAPRARELSNKGVNMTMKEREELRKLNSDMQTLVRASKRGDQSTLQDIENKSEVYQPFVDKDEYAEHAIKVLVKKAIKDDLDFVAVNTASDLHNFKHPNAGKEGIENFYGMTKGESAVQKKAKAEGKKIPPLPEGSIVKAMKQFAKQYGGRVDMRAISKSDPEKPFKVVRPMQDRAQSKRIVREEHVGAYSSRAEAERAQARNGGEIKEIAGEDPANYYEIPALVITPEMKTKRFKIYKSKGGLVVDIFKW
jgi:hypothetical protein